MTFPVYANGKSAAFYLGADAIDAEDYVSPSVSVHFDFDSLCEGLPDEELTEVLFEPDFSLNKLPEECPADFGPLEIEEPDHDE